MKNLKITGFLFLLAFVSILVISAQAALNSSKKKKVSSYYYSNRNYEFVDFMKSDLYLINFFPIYKDWQQIEKNIDRISVDSMRYVDSLDITERKDTLFVQVFTQNYAYRSSNTYNIVINKKNLSDSLKIFDFKVDLKMKDDVDDELTFRKEKFELDVLVKKNVGDVDKRLIFKKKFLK